MDKNLAIETLKSFVENTDNVVAKDAILTLHPELAESEDERITRAINNMLPFIPDETYANNGVTKEGVLNWLEKQKEQKPLSTEETELNSIAFLEQMGYTCIPPSEQKSTKDIKEVTNLHEYLYDEQKPAEWSFDNKIQYDNIKSGIEAFSKTYSFNIESQLILSLSEEQIKIWRKEIEQAVIAGGEMGIELKNDNRYKENKMPVEWSEEDEQNLLVCKNALNKYQRSDHWDANIISKWLEERLKSLRPQPKSIISDTDKSNLKDAPAIIRKSNHPFKENIALIIEKYL